ncbi:YppF-like protein [Bacillus sp. OV166]|uniref:YppF family protein n=1 Tax=Bacillus sp. OV166 TaxID=1882763 RepID=UPI000A2ABD17|nr:YppF family protein [Bacillus sp. OV166]SMQ86718.1 YppF-like protein [Bacillus sp. OV166]
MLVEELIVQLTKVKNDTPSHVNELLDYLQKRYIYEEISIVEYKKIFFELDKLKAEKPSEFFIKTKLFNLEFDIPS